MCLSNKSIKCFLGVRTIIGVFHPTGHEKFSITLNCLHNLTIGFRIFYWMSFSQKCTAFQNRYRSTKSSTLKCWVRMLCFLTPTIMFYVRMMTLGSYFLIQSRGKIGNKSQTFNILDVKYHSYIYSATSIYIALELLNSSK